MSQGGANDFFHYLVGETHKVGGRFSGGNQPWRKLCSFTIFFGQDLNQFCNFAIFWGNLLDNPNMLYFDELADLFYIVENSTKPI